MSRCACQLRVRGVMLAVHAVLETDEAIPLVSICASRLVRCALAQYMTRFCSFSLVCVVSPGAACGVQCVQCSAVQHAAISALVSSRLVAWWRQTRAEQPSHTEGNEKRRKKEERRGGDERKWRGLDDNEQRCHEVGFKPKHSACKR